MVPSPQSIVALIALSKGRRARRSTALTLSPMMNASKSKPVWETVIVCSAMLALPSPAVMVIVAEREDASGLIMEETSRPSSVRFTVSQSLPSVRVYSHSKLDSTLSSLALVGVAANGTVFSDVLMNAARSCVTRIVSETGFPPPLPAISSKVVSLSSISSLGSSVTVTFLPSRSTSSHGQALVS